LKKHGIKSVHNLPGVGKNLQDHIISVANFFTPEVNVSGSPFFLADPVNLADFFFSGTGPLAASGLATTGLIHSSLKDKKEKRPDVQLHVAIFNTFLDYGAGFKDIYNFNAGKEFNKRNYLTG
jgi:choline dehydrogenase